MIFSLGSCAFQPGKSIVLVFLLVLLLVLVLVLGFVRVNSEYLRITRSYVIRLVFVISTRFLRIVSIFHLVMEYSRYLTKGTRKLRQNRRSNSHGVVQLQKYNEKKR